MCVSLTCQGVNTLIAPSGVTHFTLVHRRLLHAVRAVSRHASLMAVAVARALLRVASTLVAAVMAGSVQGLHGRAPWRRLAEFAAQDPVLLLHLSHSQLQRLALPGPTSDSGRLGLQGHEREEFHCRQRERQREQKSKTETGSLVGKHRNYWCSR